MKRGLGVAAAVLVVAGAVWVARSREHPVVGARPNVIQIGAIVTDPPASGAGESASVREGFALAQADLDQEWRGDPHVEVVFKDCAGSTTQANDCVRELKKSGITLLADVVGSPLLEACAGTIANEGVTVLSGVDTAPELSMRLRSHFFRVAPSEAGVGAELASWARELGARSLVLVCTEGDRGTQLRGGFMSLWSAVGVPPTLVVVEGQAGAQKIVDRTLDLKPDLVVLLSTPRDTTDLLRELGQRANTGLRILLPSSSIDVESVRAQAPAFLERCLVLEPAAKDDGARRADVEAKWRRMYGGKSGAPKDPAPAVFAAYDTLQVAGRAARAAGGDSQRLITSLRTSDYVGATGVIAFDGMGERRVARQNRRALTSNGVSVPVAAANTAVPVGSR